MSYIAFLAKCTRFTLNHLLNYIISCILCVVYQCDVVLSALFS